MYIQIIKYTATIHSICNTWNLKNNSLKQFHQNKLFSTTELRLKNNHSLI